MADEMEDVWRRRSIRKASQSSYIISRNAKKELRQKLRKVSEILKKPEQERTIQDKVLVKKNPELVKASQKNARRLQATKERVLEVEDESQLLVQKYKKLADLIKSSKNVVAYTGAGISTAASIPDYRGPNGVWTLLKKGQELSPQDLSDAEPTFTHMALTKLFRTGKVKHIVSQNCDGLHIRSGFPRHAISEVHGNMYIECCYSCAPYKEFVRLFDVTERTGVHRHATLRRCRSCGCSLQDTIVHFGEKGKLKSPYRWKEAVRAAKRADLILCLGSSLKVLRKYACLWCMDKKPQHRPKLVIVNLQWTPKDDIATLKINGRCDTVMMNVMSLLGCEVPEYIREKDPIFQMCTPLRASERKTTTKKILVPPTHQDLNNRSRNKVATKPIAAKRSTRSKKRDSDGRVHLFSNSSVLWNPELYATSLDEQFMDESKFDHYREYISEDLSESAVSTTALLDLPQLQSTVAECNNSLPCSSLIDSSVDVCGFKCHDGAAAQSDLFTVVQHEQSQRPSQRDKHIAETVVQHEQSQRPSQRDKHIAETESTSNSGLEENLVFPNQTGPELVVVNLDKDHGIFEWGQQESLNEIYIFSDEKIPGSEAGVCTQSWTVHKKTAEPYVPEHFFSEHTQTRNVFQKSSSSRNVHNLSNTLDSSSSDNLSGDIIYSDNQSEFQGNLRSDHLLGTGEDIKSTPDTMLLFNAETVLRECPSSFSCNKNVQQGDELATLNPNGAILDTSNNQQHNKYVTLPAGQPVSDQIKSVSLDHCYTLPNTLTGSQKTMEPIQVNDTKCDKLANCSVNWCLPADDILYSSSTCHEGYNESCPCVSEPLTLDNNFNCNVNLLQLQSSEIPVHSNSDNLVPELCPFTQLISKEKTRSSAQILSEPRQNSDHDLGEVPSCILNMDDIEVVYAQADLSLDCIDLHVSAYTNIMEVPTVILPWSSSQMFVLPPDDGAQFQPSELQTIEFGHLTDSYPLKLQLAQPGDTAIPENSPFISGSERHIDCPLSHTLNHPDLHADSQVPDDLFQPSVHSSFSPKEQRLTTFQDGEPEAPDPGKPSFPVVESICSKPVDSVRKHHFRSTLLALQRSAEVEETEEDLEPCKKISIVPVLKKGNTNCGSKLGGRENVCRKMFKRKEVMASVPGWFGKGLIVRKKRK